MNPATHLKLIRDEINASENGKIIVPSDFYHVTEPVKVGVCLSRIRKSGAITRLMRGIYIKPGGKTPTVDDIARAIAKSCGWNVVPCGETALHESRAANGKPKIWTYAGDGFYRKYSYNGITIEFKRTNKKDELCAVKDKTAVCIQALRAIGKGNVTDAHIKNMAKRVDLRERSHIHYGSLRITPWIKAYLQRIFKAASENASKLSETGITINVKKKKLSTASGEKVYSKSEALIAASLKLAGLEYQYEKTLLCKDGMPRLPDFTIKYKGKEYYWEHLGMSDDPLYAFNWSEKKRWYDKNHPGKLLTTTDEPDLGAQINKLLLETFAFSIAPACR